MPLSHIANNHLFAVAHYRELQNATSAQKTTTTPLPPHNPQDRVSLSGQVTPSLTYSLKPVNTVMKTLFVHQFAAMPANALPATDQKTSENSLTRELTRHNVIEAYQSVSNFTENAKLISEIA